MKDLDEAFEELTFLLSRHEAVGIGEIGLDFSPHVIHGDEECKLEQIKVFEKQLLLAKEHHCYVNVHSRQAGHYVIEILERLKIEKVILHAFDGKTKYAVQAVAKNPKWFFSIPGSIQRDSKVQELVKQLPIHALLLESDAPALGPRKGEKATPLNIVETLQFVATLKDVSKAELMTILDMNNHKVISAEFI